jgi:hypothetical protein
MASPSSPSCWGLQARGCQSLQSFEVVDIPIEVVNLATSPGLVIMANSAADDPHLVVETSLSFLLNVVFGVLDVLIKRDSVSWREIVALLHDLRDEAESYPANSRDMAFELIDGALYRVNASLAAPRPKGSKRAAPNSTRGA